MTDIDGVLQRRVSTKIAAKYLGCSTRQVLDLVQAGEFPGTIDCASPKAKRASWGIPVAGLRAFIVRRELEAQRKIRAEGTGAANRLPEGSRASEHPPERTAGRRQEA